MKHLQNFVRNVILVYPQKDCNAQLRTINKKCWKNVEPKKGRSFICGCVKQEDVGGGGGLLHHSSLLLDFFGLFYKVQITNLMMAFDFTKKYVRLCTKIENQHIRILQCKYVMGHLSQKGEDNFLRFVKIIQVLFSLLYDKLCQRKSTKRQRKEIYKLAQKLFSQNNKLFTNINEGVHFKV